MSRILLARYRKPERHVGLDLDSARFSLVRPGRRPAGSPCGIADSVRRLNGRRIWLALFRHDGELWLQAGNQRWGAGEVIGQVEHVTRPSLMIAQFTLPGPRRRGLRFRYPIPWVGVMSRLDPTYDHLDHEGDDFPYYIANVLENEASAAAFWTEDR